MADPPVVDILAGVHHGWKILEGNCLDILRQLPSRSVQACVTSPPYFSLRDYGGDNLDVWGGDPHCEHDWSVVHRPRKQTGGDGSSSTFMVDGRSDSIRRDAAVRARDRQAHDGVASATCSRCGGWRGQLGLEPTVELYIEHLVLVFREVHRVLRDDGTLWLNLGDNFTDKQLNAVPWRAAFALQADGWLLRSDIIWAKANPMPEPVTDRPTCSHEYVFLLVKQRRYFYDQEPIRGKWADSRQGYSGNKASAVDGQLLRSEGGNRGTNQRPTGNLNVTGPNSRSVWSIAAKPFAGAHFAVFPPELPERCLLAGTSERGQCANCGAPWKRVIEKVVMDRRSSKPDEDYKAASGKHSNSRAPTAFFNQALSTTRKTVGWEPTCECEDETTVPQIVLDPFSGSATTGEVALKHGRHYIGIEQNHEYLKLGLARLIGAPKAELQGALIFCPGCEKLGHTKLIDTPMIERAKALGHKITCAKCMNRYTVEDLTG